MFYILSNVLTYISLWHLGTTVYYTSMININIKIIAVSTYTYVVYYVVNAAFTDAFL